MKATLFVGLALLAFAALSFSTALPPVRRSNVVITPDGEAVKRVVVVRTWDSQKDGFIDSFRIRSTIFKAEGAKGSEEYKRDAATVAFAFNAPKGKGGGANAYPVLGFAGFRAAADANPEDPTQIDKAAGGIKFLWQPISLVEFDDANGDKKYQVSEKVDAVDFKTLSWKELEYEKIALEGDDNLHLFTSGSDDGLITFRWAATSRPITVALVDGATALRPDSVELEVQIANATYTDPANRQALVSWFVAAGRFRRRGPGGEDLPEDGSEATSGEEATGDGNVRFGFTWQRQAYDENDAPIDVYHSGFRLGGGAGPGGRWAARAIAHAFDSPGQDYIYWDPSAGITEDSAAALIPSLMLPLLAAAINYFARLF